jgi:hypothetical protein
MPVSHGSAAGPPMRRHLATRPARPMSVIPPGSGPETTMKRW